MTTCRARVLRSSTWVMSLLLTGCLGEVLEKQAEQIRQQEAEIALQRKELEALAKDTNVVCGRAVREYFDKAQSASNREESIALYREGLAICPDDLVAHYELGRALADVGRFDEAAQSFETALKINPGFTDARRRLEALPKNR